MTWLPKIAEVVRIPAAESTAPPATQITVATITKVRIPASGPRMVFAVVSV
jgi:hypothetical protein